MVGVYSETSCFLPIKWVEGLLQHNPLPALPFFPLSSLSILLFHSPSMFAPSVIPQHVNRAQSSPADGFNPLVLASDFLCATVSSPQRATVLSNPDYVHFFYCFIFFSTIAPCLLFFFLNLPQASQPLFLLKLCTAATDLISPEGSLEFHLSPLVHFSPARRLPVRGKRS